MQSIRPLEKRPATLLALLVAAIALQFDLSQPLGVSGGMAYVILPLLGLLARSSLFIVVTTAAGTVLICIGMWLSPSGAEPDVVLINRAKSVALVWITASMALYHLYVGNKLQRRLLELAATDSLTGLYNRRHLFDALRNELQRYERYGDEFAVILLDADHFKQINDSYGHGVGDETLCRIADSCREAVRKTDMIGRFGGEEFIILLPRTNIEDAGVVAERIRLTVRDGDAPGPTDAASVTLSAGVAGVGPATATLDAILKAADTALYDAKRNGRDQVSVHDDGRPRPVSLDAA